MFTSSEVIWMWRGWCCPNALQAMLYSHLCDLGMRRSIKLWLVLMLFCWLNQRCVLVSFSEEKPHKLNSAYPCVNIARIMNSNKILPNVEEEMVIYSQGAGSMYGRRGTLLLRAHTWKYALSVFLPLIPVTSGYKRTWDETGPLSLRSDWWLEWTTKWFNQEWTWTELASKSDFFSSVGGVRVEVTLSSCLGTSRAPKMQSSYQPNPLLIQRILKVLETIQQVS